MAGTVTTARARDPFRGLEKIVISWTSDGSGNATGDVENVCGTIVRITTDPAATAPTDDYDVTLTDANGLDVLAGQGANRDTANSENFIPGVPLKDGTTTSVGPMVVFGTLSLSVSNAGSAKQGAITLYVR